MWSSWETELAIGFDPTTEHERLSEVTGFNNSSILPLKKYRLSPLPHLVNSIIDVPCGLLGGTELATGFDPTSAHEYLIEVAGLNHLAILPLLISANAAAT